MRKEKDLLEVEKLVFKKSYDRILLEKEILQKELATNRVTLESSFAEKNNLLEKIRILTEEADNMLKKNIELEVNSTILKYIDKVYRKMVIKFHKCDR